MNDLLITSKQIKKELITLLVSFFISFIANIGAIIYYKSRAVEILTSLPYVIAFTFFIYFVWSLLRLIKGLLFRTKK